MLTPEFLHYLAAGLAISLGAIGTGIGQGLAAFDAISGLEKQPIGNQQIFKTMVIGLAFIESGVIFASLVSIFILFLGSTTLTLPSSIVELGIAIAVGVAALSICLASSCAVRSTCYSLSRQPFLNQKILTLMLVSQSIIEAPVIFAFIISLIVKTVITPETTIFEGLKLFAACCCIGIGCIGPSAGQGIFTKSSCRAIGINSESYNKIFTFAMVTGAVIETPVIFCLLVSILIIYLPVSHLAPTSSTISFLIASLTASIGTAATAFSAGFVASKSCDQIALEPKNYGPLFRTTIVAQAFIESAAIYALLVALFLITKSY